MNIAIAGTGYVGIVSASILAEYGHNVTCVDVDEKKIEKLNKGICPIFEPELEESLRKNKNKLKYTTNSKKAYEDADVIFIAVGTPEMLDGSANLTYVYNVAEEIAKSIKKDCIIVVKSTVPIGTNDKIEQFVKSKLQDKKIKVSIVSNPEFLSQGTAVYDMRHPSRIVVGAETEHAKKIMREVYEKSDAPLVITDRRSAEMIKYASNDFLALKVSFINEIANLCESIGADITDVARGMGYDSRISPTFLNAGIGFGGSCFPKDTKALHWLSGQYDCELKTVKATIEVNTAQKTKLFKKAKNYYEDLKGKTVAILGLSFKPNTDDVRETPAFDNVPLLLELGAKVKAFDPCATENFKKRFPKDIEYPKTIEDTLKGADLCMIFTEWENFKKLKAEDFYKMKNPIILDGRNIFSLEDMADKELIYDSIGRKKVGKNLKK